MECLKRKRKMCQLISTGVTSHKIGNWTACLLLSGAQSFGHLIDCSVDLLDTLPELDPNSTNLVHIDRLK